MEVIAEKPLDKAAVDSQVEALQNQIVEKSLEIQRHKDRIDDLTAIVTRARGALDLALHMRDNFKWPEPPAAPGENPPAVGEKS